MLCWCGSDCDQVCPARWREIITPNTDVQTLVITSGPASPAAAGGQAYRLFRCNHNDVIQKPEGLHSCFYFGLFVSDKILSGPLKRFCNDVFCFSGRRGVMPVYSTMSL